MRALFVDRVGTPELASVRGAGAEPGGGAGGDGLLRGEGLYLGGTRGVAHGGGGRGAGERVAFLPDGEVGGPDSAGQPGRVGVADRLSAAGNRDVLYFGGGGGQALARR